MINLQQPSKNQWVNNAILTMLSSFITTITAGALWLKLFQNNISPTNTTPITALQEANFGGYAKSVITTFSTPDIDANSNAWALSPLAVFQCNGASGNTIYGAYLSYADGTTATATNAGTGGNYITTFVITAAGSGYQQAPAVHLTGATGANAAAHAIITAGAVTSIVLDNPGNGAYTTYTVVIDPPEQLLIASPFQNPIPVSLATDAIAYIQQLTIPPLTL